MLFCFSNVKIVKNDLSQMLLMFVFSLNNKKVQEKATREETVNQQRSQVLAT